MDLSNETLIGAAAGIVVIVLSVLVAYFRTRVSRDEVKAFIERVSPDALDAIMTAIGLRAYDAAAQISDQYLELSDEEKKALAEKYIKALLDLFIRGRTSDAAAAAILESQVRITKHPAASLTVTHSKNQELK